MGRRGQILVKYHIGNFSLKAFLQVAMCVRLQRDLSFRFARMEFPYRIYAFLRYYYLDTYHKLF